MARGFTLPDGPRAGTERLDPSAAVDAGERLGHLAAVRVLDADEDRLLFTNLISS